MRSKKVWRYYCDFCKKSGCNGSHIREHEKHCVRNPNRACRMCVHVNGDGESQQPTDVLVAAMYTGDLEGLRKVAHGCPVCILTGIVHWKDRERAAGTREEDLWVDFSFKEEKDAFWEHVNSVRAQEDEERWAASEREICLYGNPF